MLGQIQSKFKGMLDGGFSLSTNARELSHEFAANLSEDEKNWIRDNPDARQGMIDALTRLATSNEGKVAEPEPRMGESAQAEAERLGMPGGQQFAGYIHTPDQQRQIIKAEHEAAMEGIKKQQDIATGYGQGTVGTLFPRRAQAEQQAAARGEELGGWKSAGLGTLDALSMAGRGYSQILGEPVGQVEGRSLAGGILSDPALITAPLGGVAGAGLVKGTLAVPKLLSKVAPGAVSKVAGAGGKLAQTLGAGAGASVPVAAGEELEMTLEGGELDAERLLTSVGLGTATELLTAGAGHYLGKPAKELFDKKVLSPLKDLAGNLSEKIAGKKLTEATALNIMANAKSILGNIHMSSEVRKNIDQVLKGSNGVHLSARTIDVLEKINFDMNDPLIAKVVGNRKASKEDAIDLLYKIRDNVTDDTGVGEPLNQSLFQALEWYSDDLAESAALNMAMTAGKTEGAQASKEQLARMVYELQDNRKKQKMLFDKARENGWADLLREVGTDTQTKDWLTSLARSDASDLSKGFGKRLQDQEEYKKIAQILDLSPGIDPDKAQLVSQFRKQTPMAQSGPERAQALSQMQETARLPMWEASVRDGVMFGAGAPGLGTRARVTGLEAARGLAGMAEGVPSIPGVGGLIGAEAVYDYKIDPLTGAIIRR